MQPTLRFATVIGTYASAILICACAVLIGRAICVLSGHEGSTWIAPAVGLAALMIICNVAITLPGRGWTAVAVVVLLSGLSVGLPRLRGADWPDWIDAAAVSSVALIFASLPFLANARVGLLGVSLLNDTHWHLILAEGLRSPSIVPMGGYGPGYPLGPHAIAATFAQGLGTDVDKTLTGLLMATPVLTGLTALGAVTDLPRVRRWLVAVLAAIPYLAAALYAESSFKEPILSLLLLGLIVLLQGARRRGFIPPASVGVPGAVLLAGMVYDYSYPGLLWPFAIVIVWVVLEYALGGGWRTLRTIVRAGATGLAVTALVFALLVAPQLGRIHRFWVSNGGTAAGTVGGIRTTGASALANLVTALRPIEGLNLWLTGDFRFPPTDSRAMWELAGLAIIVLLFALVTTLRRKEFVWPAAILACILIYIWARHNQSPYVTSKTLAIPAPLLMVGCGAALMRGLGTEKHWATRALIATAAVLFMFFSFDSDYLVLTAAEVDPVNHIDELRALRPLLHGRPTLVLFYDDFTQWELLGVPVSSPLLPSPIPAPMRRGVTWVYGNPLDFDSVDARTLNRFDYVITTRTTAQSVPPPNFRLVGSSQSYEVWHRVGPTLPRLTLPESGHPGAVLNCATSLGRRVSRRRGEALVRAAPLYFNVLPLEAGYAEPVKLTLPRGEWELSLPFTSAQAVTVTGDGLKAVLPPNLDRLGSIWPVGSIRSAGRPIVLTLSVHKPGLVGTGASQWFVPEPLVAVAASPGPRLVPLRASCGRYVDWYRLFRAAP